MEKPILREQLKKQRRAIDSKTKKLWDQEIQQIFWELPQYRQAKVVMTYLAFGDEVDTWPILERAWSDGKRTAVPKVRKYPKEIFAVEVSSHSDLKSGFWGISEPVSDEVLNPGEIDLVIVPGLAFNKSGYRIGYGGGYYDRFLPSIQGFTVGLCYPPFLRDLPVFPWDQPVDLVIVPRFEEKGY